MSKGGKMKANEANDVTSTWYDDCMLARSDGKVELGHSGQGQQDKGDIIGMKLHEMCRHGCMEVAWQRSGSAE